MTRIPRLFDPPCDLPAQLPRRVGLAVIIFDAMQGLSLGRTRRFQRPTRVIHAPVAQN